MLQYGGDAAGVSSLMALLPDEGTGFFIAGHRERTDRPFAVWRAFADRW